MSRFELRTERLLLRNFVPADFEPFYASSADPEYRRFYAEEETTRDFWRGIFDQILAGAAVEERRVYQLAICLPGGLLIGTCGVRIEDVANRQASFGCAITRDYWGGGVALEASRHLMAYAFAHLPVHRIYAETNAENVRARALAERLGMRLEGVLRQTRFFRGRWWDTAIYGMLREELPGT